MLALVTMAVCWPLTFGIVVVGSDNLEAVILVQMLLPSHNHTYAHVRLLAPCLQMSLLGRNIEHSWKDIAKSIGLCEFFHRCTHLYYMCRP